MTGSPASLFSLTATPILRYMGDYPSRQAWTSLELTDQIFSWALQDVALQDEVYCQILKQLTHNTKRSGDGVEVEGAHVQDALPGLLSVLTPLPEAVPTVQTGRWQLMEATQPAQALAVTKKWAGTWACPSDFLG